MSPGSNEVLRALKIELQAPVCSFRLPHFLVGRQLTYTMPPPSTIYGHVASALGRWPEPDEFRFAYSFRARARGEDLEHQHVISVASGKLFKGSPTPKNVAGSVQPVPREFLFGITMTLYIDRCDWRDAFEEPCFPVVLGRSQDLACYTRVEEVELRRSGDAYLEGTLLPFSMRECTGWGVTTLMPSYVGPPPWREPSFRRYIALEDWVLCGEGCGQRKLISRAGEASRWWVDPNTPLRSGAHRAVLFHCFEVGHDELH